MYDYAVAVARSDAAFAHGAAARARADRDVAESRARAARRGNYAAVARTGVLRDANEDLRARLAEAEALIGELAEDNRRLRTDAAALADYIVENVH